MRKIDRIKSEYAETRDFTSRIAAPLSAEDCVVQSMDDVSPARWHLAHTTWFFETFVLRDHPAYEVFDEQFNYLFNSYYNTIGEQFPRSRRGLISRPSLEAVKEYRRHVDEAMQRCLESDEFAVKNESTLQIGIQHERQHQELMLTDIKHVLSCNPLWPKYDESPMDQSAARDAKWIEVPAGLHSIGYEDDGFSFDNESPSHQVHLMGTRVSSELVTCGQYMDFINDGGYERPELWLSMGWNAVQDQNWSAPLYWQLERDDPSGGRWMTFSLSGMVDLNRDWPVCHVSLFEADAFARWAGKRLPTEFEWEVAAKSRPMASLLASGQPFADHLMNNGLAIHPTRSPEGMMGGVWQWTSSSYAAYPGYQPPPGAVGEYNGKFMCNQYVLRGGSVATSTDHIRPTYRNFFPADARWQFTGIRLAEH